MKDMWNFPGSRWWKFDFHTHTPASDEYEVGTDPEEWLRMAMQSGLDCVAVTDHNSGQWIDRLKAKNTELRERETKPDWYKELTIFPGVEITVADSNDQVHLLAIFDPGCGSDKITALLGACRIFGGYGNSQGTLTSIGFAGTVDEIESAGGIAVPAHIDSKRGLLYGRRGLTPALERNLKKVIAAEVCNLQSFDAAGPSLKKEVDRLARVGGSDAHRPDEIGKHYSWIKMSVPSIEGLRLALFDHEFCVKNQTEDPNYSPDIFLSSLSIQNMRHCGLVKDRPFIAQFNPNFNSIIGGRGSGKSTVIESIRVVSRRDQILVDEAPGVKDQLDRFLGSSHGNGVMRDETRISLELYRRGKNYRLNWSYSGAGVILEEESNGTWQEIDDAELIARFPVSIFSQSQISELASNPRGLLEIVDRVPKINKAEWESRWEVTKSQFLQLRERRRQLSRQLADEASVRAKLRDIENDLEQYEEKGHGEILKQYQKRGQQNNGLPDSSVFDELSSGIRHLVSNAQISDFPAHLFEDQDEITEELKKIHEQASRQLNVICKELMRLAEQVDTLSVSRTSAIQSSNWHGALLQSMANYDRLAKEYEEKEGRLSISLYGEWVQQRNQLQQSLNRLGIVRKEEEFVRLQSEQLLRQLQELRNELFEKRRNFLDDVVGTNDFVRMELVQFGDASELEKEYRALLDLETEWHRSSIYDTESEQGLLWNLSRWEVMNTSESDLPELVSRIKLETFDIARGARKGNRAPFDNRLKTIFETKPMTFDQLDAWWPEDLLRVRYSREPGSRKFESLEKGSAGQKAAAILAFLLSYGEDPLIIDQPEDDLDNALIYDLIVKQIHKNKHKRQLIIATHNPNIVVNGDSELVSIMKFKNGQVVIDRQGGIAEQRVRDEICLIMEGGREAFAKRYRRISAEFGHV